MFANLTDMSLDVVERSPDAVAFLDREARFSYVNAAAERLIGRPRQELLGRVAWDVGAEPFGAELRTAFVRVLAGEGVVFLPSCFAHGRRFELGAALMRDNVVVSARDVTERLQAEMPRQTAEERFQILVDSVKDHAINGFAVVTRDVTERRRMEEIIRTNEERLRLATEAADLATWEYLPETGEAIPDRPFKALVGVPVDESRRYTWQDYIDLIHPADRERINRAWDEALAGTDYHVEYRIRRPCDGVERWLESRGRALRDGSGKAVRLLGVVRDVTERHRYDEFRQLLPGILAHDLRSPLSTITLASRMILESATLPANGVRYAEATLRAATQIASMAEQLLEFTQARFGGGLPLDRTPMDLGEVCREAVFDARLTSPDSEVRFDVEGDVHGRWDRTRLREVASNLLGNAIKYRAPGTPIEVAVRGESDHVVLTVHNLGAPIPAEMLPVLFDPFRYGDTSQRGPKSYGLGLYISREIVVAHGGTIDVSSSREAGTTFTVRLPRGTAAFAPASLNV